jgi:poly-gamma-glutamate capsule biosynthesis protein CapA/YwtB (metallophosphatase superfamily)
MYEAETGEFSIAVAGDTIPTRRWSMFREPRFLELRQILHGADAVFANLETNIHRYLDGGQKPHDGGGTYLTTEPEILEDIKWLGVNIMACGSSHADDYGPGTILGTIDYLDKAGIAHAGSGRHLAEARAPGFLDTPRGRVGLVAAMEGWGSRAGEQRRDTFGYPGTNGLRYREIHQVDAPTLEVLRRAGRELGWDRQRERGGSSASHAGGSTNYNLLGLTFTLGEEFATHSYANKSDVEENVRQVRFAKEFADYVIASLHCHSQGGETYKTAELRSGVEELADFAVDYAHECIDAGADVFAGHGPQCQLGVEIYKGRPIFYGLGCFFHQLETLEFLPYEAYERFGLDDHATPFDFINARYAGGKGGHPADPLQWEQAFAVCDFTPDGVKEIRIYPIELGFGKPRTMRGRPLLAEPETAERIVDRIARISKRYGTEVRYEDGVGVIRL